MRTLGQSRPRRSAPRRRLGDSLQLGANVRLRLIDRNGVIQHEHQGHNVLTNTGRNWVTRLLVSTTFPGTSAADKNMTSNNGQAAPPGDVDTYSPVGRTYRVRYVGVGVGGTLQSISPPGPGGQTEHAGVTGLERQVLVTATDYLKQVEPNDDTNDPLQFPDDYTVRIRAIFGYDDVSFAAQPTYGTNVPLTEFALYTSQAALTVTGGSGLVCYHQVSPFSKTPDFALELVWELRA